jgi:hypothetical protein
MGLGVEIVTLNITMSRISYDLEHLLAVPHRQTRSLNGLSMLLLRLSFVRLVRVARLLGAIVYIMMPVVYL